MILTNSMSWRQSNTTTQWATRNGRKESKIQWKLLYDLHKLSTYPMQNAVNKIFVFTCHDTPASAVNQSGLQEQLCHMGRMVVGCFRNCVHACMLIIFYAVTYMLHLATRSGFQSQENGDRLRVVRAIPHKRHQTFELSRQCWKFVSSGKSIQFRTKHVLYLTLTLVFLPKAF